MAAKKLLRLVSGVITEVFGIQTSAGAGNAGDIVALDDSGRIDSSMMPVGIGADTAVIVASEALAAGDFVNVWNDTGTAKVRKADATVAGKDAHGFVLAAVASAGNATVYFEGTNTQVTGQTAGNVFLQTTAGAGGSTVPSATGNVVQQIGVATSATAINFERGVPVTLA
ncbi:hypothetical protein [Ottowia sp. VDI28]|uniref:hypothetical protein n=1 Tax=Ottowia sp. VDI28 TaxID=3133968 RepID=UPI003C2C3B83